APARAAGGGGAGRPLAGRRGSGPRADRPPARGAAAGRAGGGGRMNRLALLGHGRMGKLVEQLAPDHGFEVALRLDRPANPAGAGITPESFRGIDVAIDFSTPTAVPANAEQTAILGVPLVVGTTGWASELYRVRAVVEHYDAGLLYGANFSIGVQVFYRLA